ncbi:DUF2188 domain-containing protein [Caenibius sp. WL]|uniref:DUF2188 domain-containing protein n=1 Tax=Caenibius sp. WL TaxID=2872646 RepID=UPI001C98F0BB|nr:DUF2188 domain-containing protein [Caenibius sp. WL]QZP06838.1 DUF2188 domain-containing protein [Caenibius sp. WL]
MSVGPFIVWSPDGQSNPSKQHTSHKAACHAAWEMAKANPGTEFFIMQRKGKSALVPADAAQDAESANV